MSNVKNCTGQGGEKTVIGGVLGIAAGKLPFTGTELKPAGLMAGE